MSLPWAISLQSKPTTGGGIYRTPSTVGESDESRIGSSRRPNTSPTVSRKARREGESHLSPWRSICVETWKLLGLFLPPSHHVQRWAVSQIFVGNDEGCVIR